METNEKIATLLECLIHVIGRMAIPMKQVSDVVGTSPKYLKAFNLCDGSKTQQEIAKKLKLDPGNLSKACARWVENGVAFSMGEGKDARLIHIYPIPSSPKKNGSKK